MIYGNAKAQVPLIPLWGKQNIQAKEAYFLLYGVSKQMFRF